MFARFDENPAMTLRVIKETKRCGRTDARTDNVKQYTPYKQSLGGGGGGIKTVTFKGSGKVIFHTKRNCS